MRFTRIVRGAVLLGALGCGTVTATEEPAGFDGPTAKVLIRSAPADLCLTVPVDATTVTASACAIDNPHARWDITQAAPGLYAIRPAADPSQCLSLLVPEAGAAPVVGPCIEEQLGDAGQLFHILPAGAAPEKAYLIADPSSAVYLTALTPAGVILMPRDRSSPDRQRWEIRAPSPASAP